MTIIRAQIRFQGLSGLPADVYTNTLYFSGTANSTNGGLITGMVDTFFNTPRSGSTDQITTFMSNVQDDTVEMRYYDMSDAEPRVPFFTDTWTLDARSGSDCMPEEVALCASFQGDPESGLPQARRRGRIYLGPWAVNAVAAAATPSVPKGSLVQCIVESSERMRDESISVGPRWVVFSPTNDTATNVDSGWVNNAWDTQRRRGAAATARNPWS